MTRGAAAPPLHLVEVGLAWAPDTFLRRKLVGLAERGFRVTVVASSGDGAERALPGVEVVWMPPPRGLPRMALGAGRDWLRLPAVRAAAASLPRRMPLRERLRWMRMFGALAALRPDVVHFEWETAALNYLPLIDLWGCPMVMSCRGGLDLYSHAPTHSGAVARVGEAFERATAVHCVSDATLAEATRHGLDPGKARVIRSGVDLGAFAPSQR